jgi:hypothetical protein
VSPVRAIVWVFIVLALGDLAWFIANANLTLGPSPPLSDVAVYALQILPAVVSILFPAALLARHPDAASRAPVLLLGVILFALVQAMLIIAGPLQPIFEAVTPASPDTPSLVPLAELYNSLTLLVAALGLGLMARGLSLARRYEDSGGTWVELVVPLATIFATIVGILSASNLSLGDAQLGPVDIAFVAANVALGILRVAVWAYLMASAVRGWQAREDPLAGWRLAALSTSVVLLALALVNLGGVLDFQDATIVQVYGWVAIISYALGNLGLLGAFTLGLPSLADFDDGE